MAVKDYIGMLDEMYIYSRALTVNKINSLMNKLTQSILLSNSNNLKFNLIPNPTRDILNIALDSELKSVEIYNIQGQKVQSSNQKHVNGAILARGIYMVRVEKEG